MWRRAFPQCAILRQTSHKPPLATVPVHIRKSSSSGGADYLWRQYRSQNLIPTIEESSIGGPWKQILEAPSLSTALDLYGKAAQAPDETNSSAAGDALYVTGEQEQRAWIMLQLFRDKIGTKEDVTIASQLVSHSLHLLPPSVQPCIVTLVVLSALKHHSVLSIDSLLTAFLEIKPDPPTTHYNLLLRVLALAPRSTDGCARAERILDAALGRGHQISSEVYRQLLKRSFATPSFALQLKKRIEAHGLQLTPTQSQKLHRVFDRENSRSWDAQLHNDSSSGRTKGVWYPRVATRDGLDRVRDMLRYAVRSKQRPAGQILRIFRSILLSTRTRRRDVFGLHTFLVSQLLATRQYNTAATVWERVQAYSPRLDPVSLSVGLRALTLGGNPAAAVDLLEGTHRSSREGEPVVTATAVTKFMSSLGHINRLDAVFTLWDNMEFLYGVYPTQHTFTLVLEVARRSKKYSTSIRGTLAHIGFSRFMGRPSWTPEDEVVDPRDRLAAKLRRSLSAPVTQTGFWGQQPGHLAGLRLATDVFLGNWPELLDVRSPVQALRDNAEAPAYSPMSDLIRAMRTYRNAQQHTNSPRIHALTGPPPEQPPYPTLSPSDASFRAFIHLLAANNLTSDVPLALAWMRKLQVKPSHGTLAVALVYWRAVAMDAPLIEAMKGGVSRSPYVKLKAWLLEWVGEEGMPSDILIGETMRQIERFKNADPDVDWNS
ncbi:hypothetical protein BXZ70DRAFT_566117 [Cristinia sonorae]|uniref:Uncharacterized protein n=1 Tax=Cristinia sonorae TaxID=1940300 RepID=A0A8K0XL10_9AGAR|nr:hypothetical protein BXZ70DRAFT_566117 [Cristinia sonorae]